MPKILCFDIDGTLVDRKGHFPESAKRALKAAAQAGHKLVLCTGRNRPTIQREVLDFGFDGIISSAGASVRYRGKEVVQEYLEPDKLRRFYEYCRASRTAFVIQGGQYNSVDASSAETVIAHYHKHEVFISVGERFLEEHRIFHDISEVRDAEKLIYFFSSGTLEEAQEALGDYFYVLSFGQTADPSCGEVIRRGTTKAYGLQKLIEYLGVTREEVVAFGDGPNDIEMLHFAGLGIAMGNGSDCAFEAADFVAEPIDENGIETALKHFGFI